MRLIWIIVVSLGRLSTEPCDQASTVQVREGNLGQSADFNWLGVLNVHLPEWDKLRIAVSGIVLIKIKYALANAGDVVRIPQDIFKTNTKAMFLAALNTPWFVKPASYVTHPENEYSTLNNIAIIKLNLDEVNDFPLTPICLPTADTFHASRYAYLTGFTYDNQVLEKVIYKIQYLDKEVCEEFYNREVVPSEQFIPSAYVCGYAPNSVTQCVWENGMVLVSNASGYYNLIGFGIHGPGCAAPTCFIDLFPYFSWIKSVTDVDVAGFRRKDNANKFIQNIPIHELYTMNGTRRADIAGHQDFEAYAFHPDTLKFHLIAPSKEDENIFIIVPLEDTTQYQGNCSLTNQTLVYKEVFLLDMPPGMSGTAIYKLSMYDYVFDKIACVRLNCIDCKEREDAILSFYEEINLKENTEMAENSIWETPEELFKHFYMHERKNKTKNVQDDRQLFEASYIKDDDLMPRKGLNHDLYVKFKFAGKATLEFELWAELLRPGSRNETLQQFNKTKDSQSPRRRAKSRVKNRPRSRWGIVDW